MSVNRKFAALALTFGLLVPAIPVAAADPPKTETPTDSEGVGGKENAGKEETTTSEGGSQTWGGGPKYGVLREDWAAWLKILTSRPFDPPPFPKDYPKVTEGSPDDPEGCITAVQNWNTASATADQTPLMKAMRENCIPKA